MRRVALARAGLAAMFLAAAPAAAKPLQDWRWGMDIDLGARWQSNLEAQRDDEADALHQVTGRADIRALAGPSWLGLALVFDVELGFEVPAGFVYGVHLLPVGGALRLGERAWLGVAAGGGLGGVPGRLGGFAWELPAQAFFTMDLGSHLRLMASGRAQWVASEAARQSGARLWDDVDEVELDAGFSVGKRHREWEAAWSDGTYVGVVLQEQAGERLVGLVIAVALNGASRRGR